MSVLAIVQARMSSTRLPGKVLADSGLGEPMLELLLRRLMRAELVDEICVATSTEPADDQVTDLAERVAVRVHRGPLDDTLTRFVQAVHGFDGAIVRITADCPLIDPAVVDRLIDTYLRNDCVYASNVDPPTFPDGMDCEVFSSTALVTVASEAVGMSDREHVTPAIRRDRARFPSCNLTNPVDLSHVRLTIDYAEDLEEIRKLVRALGARRFMAPMDEILAARELIKQAGAGQRNRESDWHAASKRSNGTS